MVFLKAYSFCPIINIGSSLGLLSVILLLPCVMGAHSFGSAGPASSFASSGWGGCSGGPTQSPEAGPSWKLSWSAHRLSHACTTETNPPTLTKHGGGPALLFICPLATHPCSHYQDQLYCSARGRRCMAALLSAATCEGHRASSPTLILLGPHLQHPHHQDQLSHGA